MGLGLQRAAAAAVSTQMNDEEIAFLRLLHEQGSIKATAATSLDRKQQAKIRQRCKRLGMAACAGGEWRLTALGDALFSREPRRMRPCPGPFGGPGVGPAY